MNFYYHHYTPSKNIEIHLKTKITIANELIKYENSDYFSHLCKIGCVNYGEKWSCPPYSPRYSIYSKNFKYCLLILFCCNLMQFDYVKTEYMKVKACNSILKSQSDRLSRFLEDELSGRLLSNGSCRLCKPCAKKNSEKCKKPLKRRYSLEALGLNVGAISNEYFNHELLWYRGKIAPPYTSVVSGILTNQIEENKNKLPELIWKFCSGNNISIYSKL